MTTPTTVTPPVPSDPSLAAIQGKMNKTTPGGRDRAGAVTLADAYVAANPTVFAQMMNMTYQQLVAAVDTYRQAGMVDDQWKVETFLLHRFPQMHIGGPFQAEVRIVPATS